MNPQPTVLAARPLALVLAFAAALAWASATAGARAHTSEHGEIQIIHPWVEPAETGSTSAHPTIVNDGDAAVALVGVETDAAERVELLRGSDPVDRIEIAAGDVATPEDVTLRLVGLTRPLTHGNHFPAEIVFADGRRITVHFIVGEDATMPGMESGADD